MSGEPGGAEEPSGAAEHFPSVVAVACFDQLAGAIRLPRSGGMHVRYQRGIDAVRPNVHYWQQGAGDFMFGLSALAVSDGVRYPVHPSRYTMAAERCTVYSDGRARQTGFRWMVEIDGVEIEIEGGYWDEDNCHWKVWAERVERYILFRTTGRAPTIWHPDITLWVGTDMHNAAYRYQTKPTEWFIPPIGCRTMQGNLCLGAHRVGLRTSHFFQILTDDVPCHAPVVLRSDPERPWLPRIVAARGPASETDWGRGLRGCEGFYVSLDEAQPLAVELDPGHNAKEDEEVSEASA